MGSEGYREKRWPDAPVHRSRGPVFWMAVGQYREQGELSPGRKR